MEIQKPKVYILQETGIGHAEFAGRTAYDSFDKSENKEIKDIKKIFKNDDISDDKSLAVFDSINKLREINESKLLEQLAWVYHHHSVLEHINISYYIKNISRGVLQELARHRIASYTVRSTRYTMGDILIAFILSYNYSNDFESKKKKFFSFIKDFDMLIFEKTEVKFIKHESDYMFGQLMLFLEEMKYDVFIKEVFSKEAQELLNNDNCSFEDLLKAKKKRNVGDKFKTIVTDNWKTELIMTINLRSLKNFLDLRDSGAAYYQIRNLAKEIKKVTPKKYLKLITKV